MPKGRFTKVPTEIQQIVVSDFRAGQSASSLVRKHKLTRPTVYGILRRNGLRPMDNYAQSREFKIDSGPILKAYQAGRSLPQIAKEMGISYGAARAAVIRRGVKPRGPNVSASEPLENIISAYQSGESQTSIAKRVGVSQGWISSKLRGAKVPLQQSRSGKRHGSWKGGRQQFGNGYIGVLLPQDDPLFDMANANGYVLEHRLIMAHHLGRSLDPSETVHHKNGDRADNRIENLQLRRGKHGKGAVHRCRDCGSFNIEAVELDSDNQCQLL